MIRILVTGGTIDKRYDPISGTLGFDKTQIPGLIENNNCHYPIRIKTLMLVDSLFMTEKQRQLIANEASSCKEDRVLITHGTDTMTKTAALISKKIKGKTIVLTGAMLPPCMLGSDAVFNLGAAINAVKLLPHGVYVSMNGQIFPFDKVEKNKLRGFFQGI